MIHVLVTAAIMPPKQSLEYDVVYPGKADCETLYIPIPSFTFVPLELPIKETGIGSLACMLILKSGEVLFSISLLLTIVFTTNKPFTLALFIENAVPFWVEP